jgi:ABC-2 type transport system permease protein
MVGQAVVDAGDGRLGIAMLQLLPAALLIPILLRVWARTLARSLTTVTGQSATERHAAGEGADLALLDRLPVARPTPWGAVAARELRYLVRSPRHKAKLLNTVLFGAGVPLFLALRAGSSLSDSAVLLSTVAGYLVILDANNQFGADGPATWLDVVAGNTTRALLIGKNVATTVLVLPVIALVGVLLAAVSGGWAFLPGAIVLAQAALASGLAAANVISIRYPIKVPDTRNPWGGAGGGQGCATGAVVFACTVVQAVLVLPVALAGVVGIVAGPAWLLLSAPIALGYGVLLWWFGLRLAADFGRTHEPERIIAVDPARSG